MWAISQVIQDVTKIPIKFEKVQDIDERFLRIKIYLMHTGVNLNKSYFSKEVVEANRHTLKNVPILGYIEKNNEGVEDFSDHRTELTREDGKWKWKYKCSAFGVIPEDHNFRWELVECEDGVEREFAVCEGILWRKWDEPFEILERDGYVKGQSMELSSKFSGFLREDGIFEFKTFSFFGACILGNHVQPAMIGASIEPLFSAEEILSEIKEKLNEYQLFMANSLKYKADSEGGSEVREKDKTPETVVQAVEGNPTSAELSPEGITEPAVKFEDISNASENNTVEPTTDSEPANSDGEAVNNESTNFALTAAQKAQAIAEAVANGGGYEVITETWGDETWEWKKYNYYYVDHTDDMVIAISRLDDWKYVGFDYTMNGDIPVIDFESKKFLKIEYVPLDMGDTDGSTYAHINRDEIEYEKKKVEYELKAQSAKTITDLEAKNAELNKEIASLREFKKNVELEQRKTSVDELVSKFTQLTEEEANAIRENAYASDKSLEEIENEIYVLIGKKFAKFSAQNQNVAKKSLHIKLVPENNAVVNEKPYTHIIAKYIKK